MARLREVCTRSSTYIVISLMLLTLYVVDCVHTYRELYPVAVYLTNSTTFQFLFINGFIATVLAIYKLSVWLFFGRLPTNENAALATSASILASDCLMTMLYSEQPLMSHYSVIFVFVTVWQVLHLIAKERMSAIGNLPLNVRRQKVRGVLAFAVLSVLVNGNVIYLFSRGIAAGPRKQLLADYTIAISCTQTLLVTFRVLSLLAFGGWREGDLSQSAFYINVFWSYISAAHFIGFFIYVCTRTEPPFMLVRYLLRECYSVYECTVALQRYTRLSIRMARMADATAEDLASDARCSICFEDMLPDGSTKRLVCGHCYHTQCLRQWFQSNSTCPYCRADLLKRPTAATAAAPNAAAPAAPAAAPTAVPAAGVAPPDRPPLPQLHQPTGDAALDEALREALANENGNHLSAVVAYGRYRQRMTQKAAQDAPATEPVEKTNAPASASTEKEPSAADTRRETIRKAHEARVVRSAVTAEQDTVDSSLDGTAVEPSATVDSRTQQRLKAYEEYHASVRKAEKKLKAALEIIEKDE